MNTLNLYGRPFAVIPEVLQEMIAAGRNPIAQRPEAPGKASATKPTLIGGVAVIGASGIITKRPSFWGGILFDEVLTSDLEQAFRLALNMAPARAILLDIDSPGGSVEGTSELARLIYHSRGQKPIVAFTDGMMASAAYWIASAADSIFISSDTTRVGSIGIVAAHRDITEAEKKIGIKTTEIVAGRYKRIYSSYAPLSKEGRQTIQEAVDYVYSVFVGDVAKHRGVSVVEAQDRMADGKVFIGKRAVEAGLADGVMSVDELISRLSSGASLKNKAMTSAPAGRSVPSSPSAKRSGDVRLFTRPSGAGSADYSRGDERTSLLPPEKTLEERARACQHDFELAQLAVKVWEENSDIRGEFSGPAALLGYLRAVRVGGCSIRGGISRGK